MCGILFIRSDDAAALAPRAERALERMAWRGPDNVGRVSGPGYLAGHTRLAIIDTSSDGNQPFTDASGRYVLTYNGEIYNYRELGDALRDAGRRLRTRSDTEVLLESILAFGLRQTLRRVRGMFAFALYDTQEDRLTLARDHFGQKPLYYRESKRGIVVASDPLAVTLAEGDSSPNPAAYSVYLSPAGATGTRGAHLLDDSFFAGVRMLPAGHLLIHEGGESRVESYFRPVELFDPETWERNDRRDRADLVDELRFHLQRAIERHLVADVPTGVLLSGGIDSTLVYWYAHAVTSSLTSFTKLSPGIEQIPLGVIPEVLQQRPCDAMWIVQQPSEYLGGLQRFVHASAAPSRWGGGPPMARVCEAARRNGTLVLLGGDCADEYFGGYGHYERELAGPDFDLATPSSIVGLDPASSFYVAEHAAAYEAQTRAVRREIAERVGALGDPRERFAQAKLLEDTSLFLQVCNLPHSDAYSMQTSVELRNPLLDFDLVAFAVNLPSRWKAAPHDSGHFGKRLLRELADDDIGAFVNVRKEGTRNFSMHWAKPEYWRFGEFSIRDVVDIPAALEPRDVIRLFNLECFHRQFVARDEVPLEKLLTAAGEAALSAQAPGR